jgi:hypothetical protein
VPPKIYGTGRFIIVITRAATGLYPEIDEPGPRVYLRSALEIILLSKPVASELSVHFMFQNELLPSFLVSSLRTSSIRFTSRDLIIEIVFGEEHN